MKPNFAKIPATQRRNHPQKSSGGWWKKYPRWLYVLVALIAFSSALTVTLIIYSRAIVSDEQRIHNALATIELAVEARQYRGVMSQVDDDYADEFGQNRDRLSDRVRGWTALNLTRKVELDFSDIQIEFSPDKNLAAVTLTVGGNEPIQEVLGYLKAKDNRVSVAFSKKHGWRVVGCRAEVDRR